MQTTYICLVCPHFGPSQDNCTCLSVRVLNCRDVGIPERAVDKPEYETGLADAAGAEDDDAVVVALLGHLSSVWMWKPKEHYSPAQLSGVARFFS